jgi:shikimate kinase
MNITLIGMAGAGKSHIGKKLSERYGLEQVDGDILLAERFGKEIQSILDELGEDKYLESKVISASSTRKAATAFSYLPAAASSTTSQR